MWDDLWIDVWDGGKRDKKNIKRQRSVGKKKSSHPDGLRVLVTAPFGLISVSRWRRHLSIGITEREGRREKERIREMDTE